MLIKLKIRPRFKYFATLPFEILNVGFWILIFYKVVQQQFTRFMW